MNLIEVASMTEDKAREYLESLRWPDGPVCPHCGGQLHANEGHRASRWLYPVQQQGMPQAIHGSRQVRPGKRQGIAREVGIGISLAVFQQEGILCPPTPARAEARVIPHGVVHVTPHSPCHGLGLVGIADGGNRRGRRDLCWSP